MHNSDTSTNASQGKEIFILAVFSHRRTPKGKGRRKPSNESNDCAGITLCRHYNSYRLFAKLRDNRPLI